MKKFLFPFLLTTLLLANPTKPTSKLIPIDDAFMLDSTSEIFDNSISYTHKPLLKCTPEINAVYRIESQSRIKVMPRVPLQSGKSYSCGYKEAKFSFKTEPLTLLDARFFKGEKLLRLNFSDTIEQKTLSSGLVLQKIDKLSKTNLKYTVLQNSSSGMVLQINEPIDNSTITLELNQKITTSHGTTLDKIFKKRFNEVHAPAVLDKKKKAMVITDAPQMVSLETGGFALRIFSEDYLNRNSDKYIEIEGISNFTVNYGYYISSSKRKEYGLSKAPYYYADIISSEFKPHTTYNVRLKKGIFSYEKELKSDKKYVLKTGDRRKSVMFKNDKNYISNVGELGFSSVNVDSATIVVERVLDDNLRYFMNFENARKWRVERYLKEMFSKKITLNNQKNKIIKQKFSFKSLDKKLPYGIYKITMRYSEVVNNEVEEREVQRIIFLSNLGISLNLSKEQAFVTILSLDSAKPIADATVELYAPNNDVIGRTTTNSDGVAIIEKANLLKIKPKGLVVRTKDDVNFLHLENVIGGSPMPYQILSEEERFLAHIYFQSNILRPAAKINALITLKDRDFISAKKLPVKLILADSLGIELHKKVYHTDIYGLIDFNYQLEMGDKTGKYTLEASIDDEVIGEKRFKVEAFMPPKIENTILTDKRIYKNSELIELNISSSYLFGSPSSGLQGSVKLNARPIEFHHKDYKNYSFSNTEIENKNVKSYIDYSENFVLDDNGKTSVLLSSKIRQKAPSILEAMIGVTVMDDTQPVSSYEKIKIYPYEMMVGVHIDKKSFEKGQKLRGKAVLIDPISGKVVKRKLYAVIKKINWQYDYSGGEYNWQKEIKVVENFTLNSNEEFGRDILDNGDYIVEVHDHFGGHSASSDFNVIGWGYSNISPNSDLKSVEIIFEDKLYKKGDSVEVSLKSPILEGQVMLTLESDKVEFYKLLEIHKGVTKITIPIEVDMKRGLYLHATAIRASDTPSKLIPFRAMGYKLIKANRDEHKIKVDIDAPDITKSKTSVSFNIKTSKPSKVLISIVDRGILQLVEQTKPKPFDFFNDSSDKKISYYDLYDQLMSFIAEGKLVDFGAGDMLSRKKKHLAPDLGKRIKPFMIWSGVFDVGEGERNISIDIPEFNGRASIVAIAINADSLGVGQRDITVKDDVMLKPSYPLYALVGDKIKVPLRVFNTTKEPKILTLSSTLSDNLSFILKEQNITVPPNSSKTINATLQAKKMGKGEILLTAQYGSEKVTKSVELPIFSAYALFTHTFKGIGNQSKTFNPPKEYSDAKVLISFSNNLIGALRDDLNYLVQYPHGCAEQTSSQISAMHYAKAFLGKDELVRDSKNFIHQGIKKLHGMQNYYGEFTYWQGGEDVHPYASLYAAQTLLELKRDGTEVSERLVNRIVRMLKSVSSANGDYEAKYTNFQRVYAGFILSEHKKLSESTANMLYEKGMYKDHFLSKLYMSAILKMQGKTDIATKLYGSISDTLANYATKGYSNSNNLGNFESSSRDMFLHFIIKTAYFDRDVNDLVIIQKELSNLHSTQSKAVALKAISTYLGKPKSSKLDVNIQINGQNENYTESTTIVIDRLKSKDIKLIPNGSAMSYAVELIKHLPKEIKNSISSGAELSIMREFIDEQGNAVDLQNLIQGDKIYSKVKIVNNGEIKNVVVSQRVPACLSIVNNRIKSQKAKYKDINIDEEYKEILDDRVLNFINLPKKEAIANEGIIYTPLMVTTQGECKLPAIIIEAMYDTRINDYAKKVEQIVVNEPNATRTKPTPPKKSFKQSVKELVLSLYTKEMTSNNANDFMEFFNYPLKRYYRTKDASKELILKDKRNYFRDWAKRDYYNIKVEIVSSQGEDMAKVKIVFDYLLDNGKKELKGVSRHLLTVKRINGKLLIDSIELGER